MQTIGEDRNIQTLFRELKLADERAAPRFSVVWNSAQAKTSTGFWLKPAYVVATALLIVGLMSVAYWSKDRQKNLPTGTAVVIPHAIPADEPEPRTVMPEPQPDVLVKANYAINSRQRRFRQASRRRSEMMRRMESEFRNAVAMSIWQSPTALLMQSPADDLLTTLPQLYQSVYELNSFLYTEAKEN